MDQKKHLDIGCGNNPRNPFDCDKLFAIDIIDSFDADKLKFANTDHHALLAEKLILSKPENFKFFSASVVIEKFPFKDNSFDSISAYDFIEHIPRIHINNNDDTIFPFINFMDEIYRVLKPGGIFYAITPCYPHQSTFVDPTHINFITNETHTYFCGNKPKARMYGFIGHFKSIRVQRVFSRIEKRKDNLNKKLKHIFYTLFTPSKKSHIVWQFKSIKQ